MTFDVPPFPCLPSLGERCGDCHRCTPPSDPDPAPWGVDATPEQEVAYLRERLDRTEGELEAERAKVARARAEALRDVTLLAEGAEHLARTTPMSPEAALSLIKQAAGVIGEAEAGPA